MVRVAEPTPDVRRDVDGLALHLADCFGQRWEHLNAETRAIYAAGARVALATVQILFEIETEGVARV